MEVRPVQPPLPPEPPPVQQGVHPHHAVMMTPMMNHAAVSVPPIVEMLMREADAWRAVTALHAMNLSGVRQMVGSATRDAEATLHSDDATDATEQREAQYYQNITGLAAQCDALYNELVKLRSLRKARRQVEVAAHRELMRGHSDEVVALGAKLASEGALSVTAATADLRLASQKIRNQLAQCIALLQAIEESQTSTVPSNAAIVVGLRRAGEEVELHEVGALLKRVYAHSASLTEEKLVEALLHPAPAPEEPRQAAAPAAAPSSSVRQFSRRATASDRGATLVERPGGREASESRGEG